MSKVSDISEKEELQIFKQMDRFGRKVRRMSGMAASLIRSKTVQHLKQKPVTRNVHTHGKRPRYI